ncbi:tRNA (adenosine(37)-N6)-threonylcarbamoyltransferase complex ATPase subunit type 1 TsaE [Fusibacter ferrireducens]|uniref:tRNA threonylcarbamoyladenosine biosynthesis protein TsaE n=1 Tax=Fusibacter ferrireducens TaxID=2785058 RepID=A0ABR9ZVL2_9FIRM|nr:tRNA (adenosine(37)-N6)-threonylcarbamoyltransferase complex ATPase subunit type 1 TsaE [Fusibacter ferrireducens]MBF4694487.1 tRNA (adenosine(37)-N6)-threonylcarbamoyltransferase complex ATPase subunit type 1 TsaE [Fusibacter ferrireducens]
MQLELNIDHIEETEKIAKAFSETLGRGDILCLQGDLGAGKTTFTQFLCRSLGVEEYVTSPTFNIMNAYEGMVPIYHFDVYRISEPDEMYEIGFEEYLYGRGICIVEWANLVDELIPDRAIWMTILLNLEGTRDIKVEGSEPFIFKLKEHLDKIENRLERKDQTL